MYIKNVQLESASKYRIVESLASLLLQSFGEKKFGE